MSQNKGKILLYYINILIFSNISKKFKYNDWRESDVREICSAIGVECETIFKLEDGTTV